MALLYIQDKEIDRTDIAAQPMEKAEYENCTFINLELGSMDLSGFIFTDCVFEGCNLSLCKLKNTSFKMVQFNHCKMLGLRWDDGNAFLFSVGFDHCILDMCTFYGMKLKKTRFISCSMVEVDFTEADMALTVLDDCDLSKAVFDQTNLQAADLRTSRQYIIDPENNNIEKASFSWPAVSGLLVKYDINVQ
jgi:fluoroquinolone resistance protein